MPRRSRVDDLGLGAKVIDMAYARKMSVPEMQQVIQEQDGAFVSADQIREYLKRAPAEIVAQVKDEGQMERLKPILDYAGQIEGVYSEVVALKDRVAAEVDGSADADDGFLSELAAEYGLAEKPFKKAARRAIRRAMSASNFRGFLAAVAELRKLLELAAKLDKSQEQPRSPGTVNVERGIIVSGAELARVVLDRPLAPAPTEPHADS